MINTSRSCSTTSQCNSTPNVFGNLSSQITFTVLFWNQNLIKKKTVKLFLHLWFESVSNENIYHASLILLHLFFSLIIFTFHFEKLWQQKKRTILKVNIENLPLYVCHRFQISPHDMKSMTLFHKINISKIFALSPAKFDSGFLLRLVLLCKKILKD